MATKLAYKLVLDTILICLHLILKKRVSKNNFSETLDQKKLPYQKRVMSEEKAFRKKRILPSLNIGEFKIEDIFEVKSYLITIRIIYLNLHQFFCKKINYN